MQLVQKFKKSAQDATTVTLVPATAGGGSEGHPNVTAATQIVVTQVATNTSFWGVAGDGQEFEFIVQRRS